MQLRTFVLMVLSVSAGFLSGFRSDASGGVIHCAASVLVPVLVVLVSRPASWARKTMITFGLLLILEAFRFIPVRFGHAWSYINADAQARLWLTASFVAPFAVGLLVVGTARLFTRSAAHRPGAATRDRSRNALATGGR